MWLSSDAGDGLAGVYWMFMRGTADCTVVTHASGTKEPTICDLHELATQMVA